MPIEAIIKFIKILEDKDKMAILILAINDYSFSRKKTLNPDILKKAQELSELLEPLYIETIGHNG